MTIEALPATAAGCVGGVEVDAAGVEESTDPHPTSAAAPQRARTPTRRDFTIERCSFTVPP
jgi:hypothetical protein